MSLPSALMLVPALAPAVPGVPAAAAAAPAAGGTANAAAVPAAAPVDACPAAAVAPFVCTIASSLGTADAVGAAAAVVLGEGCFLEGADLEHLRP